MKNSLLGSVLACILFIAPPASTLADTISPDIPNGYFAPLTVIGDHPQCSGLGQVAFEAAFETNNLAFEVSTENLRTTQTVDFDGTTATEESRCFLLERHGTEVERVEISCDDGRPKSLTFSQTDPAKVELSVTGNFVACQSPTSFEIMESNWEVAITSGTNVSYYSDQFFEYPKDGCISQKFTSEPSAILHYYVPGISGTAATRVLRYPFRASLNFDRQPPAYFRIDISGIPLEHRQDVNPQRLLARTSATFFPKSDEISGCADGVCELPEWLLKYEPIVLPRICE